MTLLPSQTQICWVCWSVGGTCSVASLLLSMIFTSLHLRHYKKNLSWSHISIMPDNTRFVKWYHRSKGQATHTTWRPSSWSTGEMYVPICDLLLWHLPGPITLSSRVHPSIKSSNTAVFHVSEMEVQGRSVITLSWCHCLPFDGQMTLGLCVEVAAFEKHGEHIRYVKGI